MNISTEKLLAYTGPSCYYGYTNPVVQTMIH